jgi:hypothetical protein
MHIYRFVCTEFDGKNDYTAEYLLSNEREFDERAFRRLCRQTMTEAARRILREASEKKDAHPKEDKIHLSHVLGAASEILVREHGFERVKPTTAEYVGPLPISKYWGASADTLEHAQDMGLPRGLVRRIIDYNESLGRND